MIITKFVDFKKINHHPISLLNNLIFLFFIFKFQFNLLIIIIL